MEQQPSHTFDKIEICYSFSELGHEIIFRDNVELNKESSDVAEITT